MSAGVSFTASVFLVVGGSAISVIAWRKNLRYLPIALMPLFAGLQQFMEGNVWLGMTGSDPLAVVWGAMGFMFFTWFMWPVWIPFCVFVLEPASSPRKPLFLALSLIGLLFGLLLYVPHGLSRDMIVVEINNASLAYEKSMWLDFMMPRWLTNTIYVALIVIPPALSHYRHVRHFALTLVAVIVVDFALLQYAYISFFCLLAGLATLHLVYIILTNKCAQECPELFA
ncbi:DUF6629 family protein [Roseovarius lutimaris]|nr:DUF6629 family protein [Roseovarius lutimaris]